MRYTYTGEKAFALTEIDRVTPAIGEDVLRRDIEGPWEESKFLLSRHKLGTGKSCAFTHRCTRIVLSTSNRMFRHGAAVTVPTHLPVSGVSSQTLPQQNALIILTCI
jgi:hypothetical protein